MLSMILALSMGIYLLSLGLATVSQQIIDGVASGYQIMAFTCSLLLVYAVVMLINSSVKVIFKTKLFSRFSTHVYNHLIHAPYSFFEMRSFGNLSFSLESISIVKNMYAEKLVEIFIAVGAVIFMSLYLIFMMPMLTPVVFFFMFIIAIVMKLLSKKILTLNQLEISGLTKLQEIQTEFIYSMLNIKISGIEEKVYNSWKERFDYANNKTRKRDLCQGIYSTVGASMQMVLPFAVLFTGMIMVLNGQISLGGVVALYSVTNMMAGYYLTVITTANYFQLSAQYLERVRDILDQKRDVDGTVHVRAIEEIALHNVSFRYNTRSKYVLENINMKIERGRVVAIVGKSGSGKSTLAKLLLGLIPVSEGEININGINLLNYNKNSLKKCVGMVPQDNTLFNKTIFENITMGRDDISLQDVQIACDMAGIRQEIEQMPMKYNTVVSDMGMNLSGGQRQRIILARALVNKPQLLICDEATSSLDSINETAISARLNQAGCTRIIIAHRLSTIAEADIIYVMEQGRIMEQGTHGMLMSRKGSYYQLYTQSIQSQITLAPRPHLEMLPEVEANGATTIKGAAAGETHQRYIARL
jgi:ABC-type bacteriocin/lantibiotic exporter with double-glycine peptidase domain